MSSNEYHWQSEFQRGLEDERQPSLPDLIWGLTDIDREMIFEAQDDAGLFE